jgi:hypothetical protein
MEPDMTQTEKDIARHEEAKAELRTLYRMSDEAKTADERKRIERQITHLEFTTANILH